MHPVAVINAGPLVALSVAGQLELLPSLFDRIVIPRAVYQNTTSHKISTPAKAKITGHPELAAQKVRNRQPAEVN